MLIQNINKNELDFVWLSIDDTSQHGPFPVSKRNGVKQTVAEFLFIKEGKKKPPKLIERDRKSK